MSDANKHKVLIIIGDASETVDTMYPYFRLIEGGYEPILAAPEKRTYQMVMHQNKPGWTIWWNRGSSISMRRPEMSASG